MFETGVNDFHVVLGDSNLKIDLPFGVQQHEISQVIVHENYRPDDSFHYQDIGLIKLQTVAKMETTVCTLCLPETFKDYTEDNCTVVGYGRPSTAALNQFARGIIEGFLWEFPYIIFCLEFCRGNRPRFNRWDFATS